MGARLQKEVEEFQAESGYGGSRRSAIPPQPSGWSGFTSTPVPMFVEKTSWNQYRQVFEAIVSSNGWDGVTAALQPVSHLKGDTLNVALLVPAPRQVLSGVLLVHLGDWRTIDVSLRGFPGCRGTIRGHRPLGSSPHPESASPGLSD